MLNLMVDWHENMKIYNFIRSNRTIFQVKMTMIYHY